MKTMQKIFGGIIKNQTSGGKWLVSEAIMDTVRVYVYCSGDDVDDLTKVELDHIVEEQDGSGSARQLRRKNYENAGKCEEKTGKYLEPLLHFPSPKKYHWWFALILDPLYVNELTDARALHKIESVDTRSVILEIMTKSYDYILAAELSGNHYTAPPAVTTTNWYLYFSE